MCTNYPLHKDIWLQHLALAPTIALALHFGKSPINRLRASIYDNIGIMAQLSFWIRICLEFVITFKINKLEATSWIVKIPSSPRAFNYDNIGIICWVHICLNDMMSHIEFFGLNKRSSLKKSSRKWQKIHR